MHAMEKIVPILLLICTQQMSEIAQHISSLHLQAFLKRNLSEIHLGPKRTHRLLCECDSGV